MRWALAVMLVSLAACGRSDQDVNNAVAAERAIADNRLRILQDSQNAALAARECADREARLLAEHRTAISNDERTILTTLEGVSNAASESGAAAAIEFAVNIETLGPSEWRWVETENSAAVSATEQGELRDRINYSVSPSRLSSQVQIVQYAGMPAVQISCASGRCIRAIGRRIAHYNGQNALQDIDEMRASNVWALGTANRAQVVRDALSDLIGRLSNPPRAGTCTPVPAGM